jgi:hypothetical protein
MASPVTGILKKQNVNKVRVLASCLTPNLEGQSISSLHRTALKSIPSMGVCYIDTSITSKLTDAIQLNLKKGLVL